MDDADVELTPTDRARLAAIRSAGSLADLARITGAGDEHAAYFEAKREWRDLRERELVAADRERSRESEAPNLPGALVVIDGHEFHVHGITHEGTDAERAFLREHVSAFLDRGATVYCEQGIRPLYFRDFDGVCAMDDYRWARRECELLDGGEWDGSEFGGVTELVDGLTARFTDAVFSLIDSGGDVYGEEFQDALGDVASGFLASHADVATGSGFESYVRTRRASEDPSRLGELQRYYETTFLPQPLEREWLRRHDPELEIVTHARSERMADYVVAHNENVDEVHVVVGAAHQPGIRYYLEQFRDGERGLDGFELVG